LQNEGKNDGDGWFKKREHEELHITWCKQCSFSCNKRKMSVHVEMNIVPRNTGRRSTRDEIEDT
jgi:hypothetical protein